MARTRRGPGGPGWEYTPPGETPPSGSQPLDVRTSYDDKGTVKSSLPLRGIDIGEQPDFWGDLAKIMALRAPRQAPAAQQAQALRGPAMAMPQREESRPTRMPQYDYEPVFATLGGHGAGYTTPFYSAYNPGQTTPYSAGGAPVATGYRRVLRGA